MSTNERLLLINIRVATNDPQAGESIWTKPLGDNLYELQSASKLIDNLHAGDVILMTNSLIETRSSDLLITRQNGREILQVMLLDKAADSDEQDILSNLQKWSVIHKREQGRMYILETKTEEDKQAVYNYLEPLLQKGCLVYQRGAPAAKPLKALILGPNNI